MFYNKFLLRGLALNSLKKYTIDTALQKYVAKIGYSESILINKNI